jgi:hypothetical protein
MASMFPSPTHKLLQIKARIEGVLHGCMLGLFGENGYLGIVDIDEEEPWDKGPDFEYTWFTANTNAKGVVNQ